MRRGDLTDEKKKNIKETHDPSGWKQAEGPEIQCRTIAILPRQSQGWSENEMRKDKQEKMFTFQRGLAKMQMLTSKSSVI